MRSAYLQKKLFKKKKQLEIDITSLLDILVILLVFLIKAYNPDDATLRLVEDLNLPTSSAKKIRELSITVQVDKKRQIWVKNKNIGILDENKKDLKVESLYISLQKERETLQKETERNLAGLKGPKDISQKKLTRVNVALDKDLPYSVLKKIMHTSNLAGLDKFKFIVVGIEGAF